MVAHRGGGERAELAADGVGVLVEPDRRATRGQCGCGALELRVPLLGEQLERLPAVLVGEGVVEALGVVAGDVVHDDRGDRLDALDELAAGH
ncbi:hypothetical protein ACLGIH_34225 [Streptomyces sp. HMX87]|uniref:hypothetical protein n=1 Tax=Streptomyces sp. HMX87 TaxID=3390849 RepID=UPI003A8A2084